MVGPTLLVLAAGMGSRHDGLKIAEPVGPLGETILDYSLYDARQAGFAKVVFVIRRDVDRSAREALGGRMGKKFTVEFVCQEVGRIPWGFPIPLGRNKPWGTTHAVLTAASLIREPFAVINVDDFYGAESYRTLARHLQSGTRDAALVGFVLRNTLPEFGSVARGICRVGTAGYVEGIEELKNVERQGGHAVAVADGSEMRLSGDEVVSMNMWGFLPDVFVPMADRFDEFLRAHAPEPQAECFLPKTVDEMIAAGDLRVKVLRCVDAWFGVTYREDHPRAVQSIRQMIDAGYYPRRLWG